MPSPINSMLGGLGRNGDANTSGLPPHFSTAVEHIRRKVELSTPP